ncbi:putative Pollike protein, partial [Globisporangium splendens]
MFCMGKRSHRVRSRKLHPYVSEIIPGGATLGLQDHLTATEREGYAVFLDFEKAYDRVNWKYLFAVLDRMGCGPNFLLNGFVQRSILPSRGVKQGDPLSSLLFVLSIEPLGDLLRNRQELGIQISHQQTATGLYFADDSTLLASSAANVHYQLDLVEIYCAASGAEVNLAKSAVLGLDRTRLTPDFPSVRTLAPTDQVTYLGIPFGSQCAEIDLLNKLDTKFYQSFLLGSRRARTLHGRALVVNTLILSQLWHFTIHLSNTEKRVSKWQMMVNKFLLSRKPGRDSRFVQLIPPEFLYSNKNEGGLKFPNIGSQIQVQRVKMLQEFIIGVQTSSQENWTVLAMQFLTPIVPGGSTALDFLGASPSKFRHMHNL